MWATSKVEYIDHMGDDRRACDSARVSLLNDDPLFDYGEELSTRDKRLLTFLMKERHTSPFEHSVMTLRVYAPLPVVAQIMRHRTGSYNQASRRYTAEDIEFFDIGEFRKQSNNNLQASLSERLDPTLERELIAEGQGHIEGLYKFYCKLLHNGVCREQARFYLPQGLMGRFWMTMNLHNYLKFLILRDSPHAQKECREVAEQIMGHLKAHFPETMGVFQSLLETRLS